MWQALLQQLMPGGPRLSINISLDTDFDPDEGSTDDVTDGNKSAMFATPATGLGVVCCFCFVYLLFFGGREGGRAVSLLVKALFQFLCKSLK